GWASDYGGSPALTNSLVPREAIPTMNLISPRRVLTLAVVALGLLAAPSAQAFPYQPITGTQFFTPDGVWNKPLATNAPLGSNSKQLSSMLSWEAGYYGSYINTASYSAPVYTM